MEKTSDDPLTVKYTINEDLKWSDGEPITADDLLLGWAIGSGYYDDATLDPETEEVAAETSTSDRGSARPASTRRLTRDRRRQESLTLIYSSRTSTGTFSLIGQAGAHRRQEGRSDRPRT